MLTLGCGEANDSQANATSDGSTTPDGGTTSNESGVSPNAPAIEFYAGAGEECCGEDPHPVHGIQTPDGGYLVAGKSMDSGGTQEGFALKVGPPAPQGTVMLGEEGGPNYQWSFNFGSKGVIDAANAVASTADAAFILGYKTVADKSVDCYLSKHDLTTGKQIWETHFPDPTKGKDGAFEIGEITKDGGLITGGVVNADTGALEGFKSYGNPEDGDAMVMFFSADQINSGSAPQEPVWMATYPELRTVKGLRAIPDNEGGYIVLSSHKEGYPVVMRINATGKAQWTKYFKGEGEPTDITVVVENGEVTGSAFIGLTGSDGTLDGFITRLDTAGEKQWKILFGDPKGGVGEFKGLGAGNPKLIYDECWAIQALPDGGFVTGCGTGIEGCEPWQAGSDIKKECIKDPRVNWRGMVTRFDRAGKIVWQRVDSFDLGTGEAGGSAACEYVSLTSDGGFMSVVDQGFGIGIIKLAPESSVSD